MPVTENTYHPRKTVQVPVPISLLAETIETIAALAEAKGLPPELVHGVHGVRSADWLLSQFEKLLAGEGLGAGRKSPAV